MGNTSSEPLGHSFKRLRLSETDQLSHTSPSSISPKRKIVASNDKHQNSIANDIVGSSNDGTPVILYNDLGRSTTATTPTLQPSRVNTKSSDKALCSYDNCSSSTQSFATSATRNDENNLSVVELSDEEIILCLRSSRAIPQLSDEDLVNCLTQLYGNKNR